MDATAESDSRPELDNCPGRTPVAPPDRRHDARHRDGRVAAWVRTGLMIALTPEADGHAHHDPRRGGGDV